MEHSYLTQLKTAGQDDSKKLKVVTISNLAKRANMLKKGKVLKEWIDDNFQIDNPFNELQALDVE